MMLTNGTRLELESPKGFFTPADTCPPRQGWVTQERFECNYPAAIMVMSYSGQAN